MKESDIRPKGILDEYLRLVDIDSKKLNSNEFVYIHCPGCGESEYSTQFLKNKYTYVVCKHCGSLYCNPRPKEEILNNFYKNADSSKYWSNVFFPSVVEKRREKLFKPKAERIFQILSNRGIIPNTICDVGSGYGIFLEELKRVYKEAELYGIEPSPEMVDISRKKGITTLATTAENSAEWNEKFDLVISSEVIEHIFSVEKFVKSLFDLINTKGYCLVTGLGYEGFDILSLQEHSNSVFPPHHLNFLSIKGFEILFKSCGFRNVEIFTPGVLDFDIVLNSGKGGEFVRVLFSRGDEAMNEFQKFLQKFKLSSHIWILAEK